MKDNEFAFDERQMETGLNRLIEDLKRMNTSSTEITESDQNSLSLVVNEALNGVDIRKRFPLFYDHLLCCMALRKQFIENLLSLKETWNSESTPTFATSQADLAFLHKKVQPLNPAAHDWKVILQRTVEQLMSVFAAPQATLRGEVSVSEPVYTLLRSEFLLDQTTYSLILEGTLNDNRDDVLTLTLNMAAAEGVFHPLLAKITWGEYSTEVQINSEGRTRVDDLPLQAVFDDTQAKIVADLQVTLKAV